jgi:amidohydrolase
MHACGHDGHMAIMLGAIEAIATQKAELDGTVYFIFQPAEEGLGGAKAMVEDGLFERFKIDKIFGIHNRPTEPYGKIFIKEGTMMASYDNYQIEILGKSTHSSMPHTGKNPIVAAAHIVAAMKSITSLDLSPNAKSVVTVASIHGGEADNIIPDNCIIRGSIRAFEKEVRKAIETRVKEIATHMAQGFGMEAKIEYHTGYPATVNTDIQSALQAAVATVGESNTITDFTPSYGSEDFSYFLEQKPGCYAWLGSGKSEEQPMTLHSSSFDFNDDIIPIGVRYYYEIAKRELGIQNSDFAI